MTRNKQAKAAEQMPHAASAHFAAIPPSPEEAAAELDYTAEPNVVYCFELPPLAGRSDHGIRELASPLSDS